MLDESLEDLVPDLAKELPKEHDRWFDIARGDNDGDVAAENGHRRQGHIGEDFGDEVVLGKLDVGDGERGEGVMRRNLGGDLFCSGLDNLSLSCS